MPDSGDEHVPRRALPKPPAPIKPQDLRVECWACGGSGREWRDDNTLLPHGVNAMIKRYVGPCKLCEGMGKRKPRHARC